MTDTPPPGRSATGIARWPLIAAGAFCLLEAVALALSSICIFAVRCAPPETGTTAAILGGMGMVFLALAALGSAGVAAARLVGVAISVPAAAIAGAEISADWIVESADPYGYVPGPRRALGGLALAVLGPAALVAAHGLAGHLRWATIARGRPRALAAGVLLATFVAGAGWSAVTPGPVGGRPTEREFTSSAPPYHVVLPRGFTPGGTYVRGFIGEIWSLPKDTDWFERDESNSVFTLTVLLQLSVRSIGPTSADLASLDRDQARIDAALFGEPEGRTDVLVAGHPAVRREYSTATRPRVPEPEVDDRFFLSYEGPNVRVVRVITVVDGMGWVLSLYAAPNAPSGTDHLFETFVGTFRT
jgi:hypothetical protein